MSSLYRSARGNNDDAGHGEGHDDPANVASGAQPVSPRVRVAPELIGAGVSTADPAGPGRTENARSDALRQDLQRQRPTETRSAAGALLAREHELARWRAQHIPGETAAAELAERITFARRHAGKPSLAKLSLKVGYSKATLSKVLSGKMAPTWGLVRKLGEQLRVPPQHITQEWLPLWIAADTYRDATKHNGKDVARGTAPVPPPGTLTAAETHGVDPLTGTGPGGDALTGDTGYTCPKCGGWVVNTAVHTGWHMQHEPDGRPAPAAESTGVHRADTAELTALQEIFRTPNDA